MVPLDEASNIVCTPASLAASHKSSRALDMNLVHRGRISCCREILAGQVEDGRNVFSRLRDIVAVCHRSFNSLSACVLHPVGNRRGHDLEVIFTGIQQLPHDMRAQKSRPPVISIFFPFLQGLDLPLF
jgi:hypothetical protein